jgi:serine/threonine protein kinase
MTCVRFSTLQQRPAGYGVSGRLMVDDLIGKKIGGYEIQSWLGRGGMGVVYKAYQASLKRHVAIKILPSHLSHDTEFLDRFTLEARVAAKLNHPNIVVIYDVGGHDGIQYLAMELIEGEELVHLVTREKHLDVVRALKITRQIAGALASAHELNIIHRDIKPTNIMVDRFDRAKVLDFGIARLMDEGSTRLTLAGSVLGTPEYMSPEQCAGLELTGQSDLYSMMVTLYYMLAGQTPHTGSTPIAVIRKIIDHPPPPIRQFNPRIANPVADILARGLAKDLDQRYQTGTQIVQQIDTLLLKSSQGLLGLERTESGPVSPTVVIHQTVINENYAPGQGEENGETKPSAAEEAKLGLPPGHQETVKPAASSRPRQRVKKKRRLYAGCLLVLTVGGMGIHLSRQPRVDVVASNNPAGTVSETGRDAAAYFHDRPLVIDPNLSSPLEMNDLTDGAHAQADQAGKIPKRRPMTQDRSGVMEREATPAPISAKGNTTTVTPAPGPELTTTPTTSPTTTPEPTATPAPELTATPTTSPTTTPEPTATLLPEFTSKLEKTPAVRGTPESVAQTEARSFVGKIERVLTNRDRGSDIIREYFLLIDGRYSRARKSPSDLHGIMRKNKRALKTGDLYFTSVQLSPKKPKHNEFEILVKFRNTLDKQSQSGRFHIRLKRRFGKTIFLGDVALDRKRMEELFR